MRVFILFSTRPCGFLTRFSTVRLRIFTWVSEKISGSPLVHVAISDGVHCFSPGIYTRLYYNHDTYINLPNVQYQFELVAPRLFSIDGFGTEDNIVPIWRTVLKVLTRGRVQTKDCLCMTKKVMAAAGWDVPKHVTTPQHLFDWITTNAEVCNIKRRPHFLSR